MKMRQVCEDTGLTEKAVRLYIKQELVHPTVTEGLHNQSYDFSPEDVRQLKTVAALRAADFSMADIRELQQKPELLPAFLEERRTMLEADIRRKKTVAEALDRLTAAQTGSLEEVAESMRPAQRQMLESGGSGFLPVLVLALAVVLVLWLSFRELSAAQLQLAAGFIGVLAGFLAVFMAVRYGTCTLRARRLPNRAVGTVVSVTKQTGYDASFSIQTTATSGPRWGGNGGLWAMFFMLWGEIRPDHWVPVVQFTDGAGKLQSGAYPYGGLKLNFREGDRVEIAWEKYPQRVLPLHAPWLMGKAVIWFVLGMGLLLLGGSVFGAAFSSLVVPYTNL